MNAKRRIAKLTLGQSNPHWWVGSDAPSDVSFIAQTASHVSESVATSEFLSEWSIRASSYRLAQEGLRSNLGEAFIEQSRPKVDWRRLKKAWRRSDLNRQNCGEFRENCGLQRLGNTRLGLSCQQ